jgi:serine/threonine-protein kinase
VRSAAALATPVAVSWERLIGRYALYDEIASGGMASVHFGRLLGPGGFARSVAIKRLHAHFAKDPEFVAMFLDEARLAARVRHPNVVPTIDVVAESGELFLVMEYVQGESLARLLKAAARDKRRVPPRIAATVAIQTLWGLHAAHEAKSERGAPLGIIHRDVSPQNILVGDDGVARIVDFGVAKAAWRYQSTREGQLKGKLAYMAPEQVRGGATQDRRVDVYAAAVVLWETLCTKRYVPEDNPALMLKKLLEHAAEPPSRFVPDVPPELDAIVLRGMAADPGERFATASEMADALEGAIVMASPREIAAWVRAAVGSVLEERARMLSEIESASAGAIEPPSRGRSPAPPPAEPCSGLVPVELPSSELQSVVGEPGTVSGAAGVRVPSLRPARWEHAWRRWLWLAAVGVGAAGSLAVWLASAHRRAGVAPESLVLVPPASMQSADTSAAAPSDPAPLADAPASGLAQASVEAPPPRPPVTRSRPGTLVGQPTSSAPGRPPRAECSPPYTVDGDGVRIPKPRCLHP